MEIVRAFVGKLIKKNNNLQDPIERDKSAYPSRRERLSIYSSRFSRGYSERPSVAPNGVDESTKIGTGSHGPWLYKLYERIQRQLFTVGVCSHIVKNDTFQLLEGQLLR